MKEMFENCGSITSIRLSKKNFAHIRFDFEESVDKAIYLSGKNCVCLRYTYNERDHDEEVGVELSSVLVDKMFSVLMLTSCIY